jgi:Domain of unknown function (DUF222)
MLVIELMFDSTESMSVSPAVAAHRLVVEAVDALADAAGPMATSDEALSVLTMCEGVARRLDQLVVGIVADLVRRGVFAERGYRDAVAALADLLGWDRAEARRRVSAAEQVCPRTTLDGAALPARLPATAGKFAAGAASLRHVDVISRVLGSPAARRLAPEVWAGAEVELAAHTERYTPAELLEWGTRLVDTLDQDGPEPDDRPPDPVNELHLQRFRGRPGGSLKGHFDDAATTPSPRWWMRRSAPPTPTIDAVRANGSGSTRRRLRLRPRSRRRACLWRSTAPSQRAGAAGGPGKPGPFGVPGLRWRPESRVAADAVLRRGRRARRTRRQRSAVGRRAVHTRHPGRAAASGRGARRWLRPLRPTGVVVRDPPRHPLGAGWGDVAGQHHDGVPGLPSVDPPRRLGRQARCRAAGVLPAAVDRPAAPPPPPTTPVGLWSRRLTAATGDPCDGLGWTAPVAVGRCRSAPLVSAARQGGGVTSRRSVAEACVQHADELADPSAAVGRWRKAVEHVDDGW